MSAIDSLKKGKFRQTPKESEQKISSELMKKPQKKMRDIFNLMIIKQDSMTPSARKKVMIKVIFKKGDPSKPENYRPIYTLPMYYRLFFTMLHNRLFDKLDSNQFPDQGGFRKQFQTTDHHLMTYREWGTGRWVAAVAFQKACDSIRHDVIWRSPRNHLSVSNTSVP